MKLIIDIPYGLKDVYEHGNVTALDVEEMKRALQNGTPITDNATNGDVIKAVFPQWKILDYADKDMIMFNIPMKVGCEFNACSRDWWKEPYQKGGKE